MTIVAEINRTLGIRTHRLIGRVTVAEFLDVLAFYRDQPHLAQADMINFVDEAADVSALVPTDIATLKATFRQLHEHLRLEVIRRCAWVCPHIGAWDHLEAWLQDRHSRDGAAAEVCLVAKLEEASVLFDRDELDAVSSGVGFVELQRFDR